MSVVQRRAIQVVHFNEILQLWRVVLCMEAEKNLDVQSSLFIDVPRKHPDHQLYIPDQPLLIQFCYS